MKKRITLFLATFVLLILAVVLVLLPMATEDNTSVLRVDEGEGMTFDGLSLYHTAKDNPVTTTPVTYEAWVKLPAGYTDNGGTIYGNYYNDKTAGIRFRFRTNGNPQLFYSGVGSGKFSSKTFSEVYACNGEWTHIVIVDDIKAGEMRCYINGELAQSSTMTADQINYPRVSTAYPMCIGGDHLTGTNRFVGSIRSVAVYKDVRTADEIKADMKSIDLTDENLISAYDLNNMQGSAVLMDATGRYDMINNRQNGEWADPEQVAELDDFAYSLALIGDTQVLAEYYPEKYHTIIDWLLENKEEHKIEHVLNLGDFTNGNYDWEWDNVREQWFRLNGELDYTLVRGDHDVLDDGDDKTDYDADKYDMWFDVPEYTDRFNNSEDADYYRGENGSITNSYRAINIKGNKYLIVTVDKYPSEDVLAWLDDAIKKYPEHRVIMTMHCFIDQTGEHIKASTKPNQIIGAGLWERIKDYANLEMVICGHEYAYGVVWTKAEGTNGNVVNQILVNPQGVDFDRSGACGMIAMLYFSEDGTDVQVRYYSTIHDKFYVANNNTVTDGNYKLDTSVFNMKIDDFSSAVQLKTLENYKFDTGESTLSLISQIDGNKVNVKVNLSSAHSVEKGKIKIKFDNNYLSVADVSKIVSSLEGETAAEVYDGVIILTFADNKSGGNITLFEIEFDSVLPPNKTTGIVIYDEQLTYVEGGENYILSNVVVSNAFATTLSEPAVIYDSGDSFKAKLEEALMLTETGDVKLVLKSGVTFTESQIIGTPNVVYPGTVNIVSENTESPMIINLNNFSVTLIGNFRFDFVAVGSATAGDSGAFFFPNGSSAVFGNNVTSTKATANITGADIELYSGSYYFVGAVMDETVGDFYNNGVTLFVMNPRIVLGGTAVANDVAGGARLKKGVVAGCSEVYIRDGASVSRNLSASGYASNSIHDGYLEVDTTGVIGRLCAAIGTVGQDKMCYPDFTVKIYNADCSKTTGFLGINAINENKKNYANTNIEVYGGNFTEASYGGLYTTKTGVVNKGGNSVKIYGGTFNAAVYGSAYCGETKVVQEADSTLEVFDGSFTSSIYGGSNLAATVTEQSGDSHLMLKGGTFGANTEVYGGSLLYQTNTVQSGDVIFDIYGGITLKKHITGGCKFWYNGTGYATEEGNGTLCSGDVTFNIFDYDKDGKPATLSLPNADSRLFAAGYGNSSYSYAEMTGDVTFNYSGVAVPKTSFGGLRAQGKYTRMSGDITGTLNNVTFQGSFFGGAELVGAYAENLGDITITLINCDVTKECVAAGSKITKTTQNAKGNTTLNYVSGTVSGNIVGGNLFAVPNVKIYGDSKVVFGSKSGAPSVAANGRLIGGSMALDAAVTAEGKTTEWGVYGSSDLIINSGTVSAGGYVIGGSCVDSTETPSTTVDWDKYPVVGGVPGESNKNHTKLTINGGTVNGPKLYAGSYLAVGGQDHGHVILEVNGGTVKVTADCIDNYPNSADVSYKCIYPATYYPTNTKEITCDYTLTLNGGYFDNVADKTIGFAVFHGYDGVINGDTELNIAITTQNGKANTKYRVSRVVGGINEPQPDAVLKGNSTLNIYKSETSTPYMYPGNPMTAGCYLTINDKKDNHKVDTDTEDGILHGFTQIGDVTMNVSAGTINRTTLVSGFASNVDGDVYVNISNCNIEKDVHGVGDDANTTYSSVTGDVVWNIGGCTLKETANLYAGGDAKSGITYKEGYNVILGDLFMEISGGTFNGTVSLAGNNSVSANSEARIKFVGDKYSFGTNGNVIAHGSVCSTYVGTYTLDMYRADKTVPYTESGFTQIFKPFDGSAEIVLANVPAEGIIPETELKSIIPETVYGYSYAALTKFDGRTEYDNAFTIHDAEKDTKLDKLPLNVVEVCFGVGDKRTGVVGRNYFSLCAATLYMDDALTLKYKAMNSIFTSEGLGFTDPYITIAIDRGESGGLFESGEIYPVKDGNSDYVVDDSGRILFEFKGLSPAFMGAPATIVLHGTRNGIDCSAGTISYNIVSYAKNLLVNENAPQEMKKLVVDLLYYGAEVQKYSNTNIDNLPTAIFSEEPYKQYAALKTEWNNMTLTDNSNADKDLNNPTASFTPKMDITGAVLNFDNSIRIDITVGMNDAEVFNGAKAVIWTAGFSKTHTIVLGDIDDINQRRANARALEANSAYGYRYRVSFRDLVPNMGRECFYIKFVDAEGNDLTNTLCYSFESYSRRVLDSESAGEQVKDLARALMAYCDSAKDYVAFKNNK